MCEHENNTENSDVVEFMCGQITEYLQFHFTHETVNKILTERHGLVWLFIGTSTLMRYLVPGVMLVEE